MTTLRVGKNNPTQGKIKVLAFGGGEAANIVTQKWKWKETFWLKRGKELK